MDHHMIERAMLMDRLAPGTLKVAAIAGTTVKHSTRNHKDRTRRLQQRDMQEGNVNTIANRKVRFAARNESGKITYSTIILQIGDRMPPKLEKLVSDTNILQKDILKKI
jgi:hypothetical protein